jgi:hypothetical protein
MRGVARAWELEGRVCSPTITGAISPESRDMIHLISSSHASLEDEEAGRRSDEGELGGKGTGRLGKVAAPGAARRAMGLGARLGGAAQCQGSPPGWVGVLWREGVADTEHLGGDAPARELLQPGGRRREGRVGCQARGGEGLG